MTFEGYTIAKEDDGTYKVSVGDKVVNRYLSSNDAAKQAVRTRIEKRRAKGLEPAG